MSRSSVFLFLETLLLCLPMLGQESPNDQLQGKEQLMYEASVGP